MEILCPILVFGIVAGFLMLAAGASRAGVGQYDALLTSGLPARGILLSVSSASYGRTQSGVRRFQQRGVVIDVEVPGRAPYEVSANLWIPANLVRDVLPGATVELRVDPSDPNKVAIVGPGVGFVGANLIGASQGGSVPQTRAPEARP